MSAAASVRFDPTSLARYGRLALVARGRDDV